MTIETLVIGWAIDRRDVDPVGADIVGGFAFPLLRGSAGVGYSEYREHTAVNRPCQESSKSDLFHAGTLPQRSAQ